MATTKDIGDISEAYVTAALLKAGEVVLRPIGDNLRYDIALDRNGELVRVQCKTGRYRNGAVLFLTHSSYDHVGSHRKRKSYKGEIEYFGVYCPFLNKAYLVPVDEVGETVGTLRVLPPRNSQYHNVRWADKFEISKDVTIDESEKIVNAKCPDCGKKVPYADDYPCDECRLERRRKMGLAYIKPKITWPDTGSLAERVNSSSFVQVAKELSVSDSAIRKRLKKSGYKISKGKVFKA